MAVDTNPAAETVGTLSSGGSVDHTGLLSVDLPDPLRRGERFDVIVRQVTNASGERRQPPPPPPPGPGIDAAVALGASASRAEIHWRRVLGAFQLSIPVKDKAILLEPEERLLSVMRWIGQAIPTQSRWYLVFRRYLERLGGRVASFGGDPTQIEPSPTGQGKPRPHPHKPPPSHPTYELTGKIAGLSYDHFGDFDGFILETDHQHHHHFHSREPEIAELAQRAWRERLRLTVYTEPHHPNHPVTITIHPPPTAFSG